MKSAWPILFLLLLGVFIAVFWVLGSDSVVPDVIDGNAPKIGVDESGRPILDLARENAADPSRRAGKPLPKVRFRFVDEMTNQPIEGGRIYRVRDGEVLGTTDEDGFVTVEGARVNAVVFGADGYFLEHFFDREERARGLAIELQRRGHAVIMLRRDDLTTRCRLRFVLADGSEAPDVQFRLKCLEEPPPDGRDVPTARMGAGAVVSPGVRAAWRRHLLLSTLSRPDFNPDFLHFGKDSESESFRCAGMADVRFVAPGAYRVEAVCGDQFRRRSFDVSEGGEVTIELEKGGFVAGQVIDAQSREPLPGAGLVLRRKDETVTSDLTDVQGVFRLGPVGSNSMRLEIHHEGYEPRIVKGVRPNGPDQIHALKPLANHLVRGVVRRMHDRRPVGGAVVRLVAGDGTVSETKTDAQGAFEVRSYLIEPTLEIVAEGFLEYAEMLNANGEHRVFELIPAAAEERVRQGLSSLVKGKLLDAKGKAVPNRPVQARPVNRGRPPEFSARRILKGGRLVSTRMATTDEAGEFRIEWVRSEAIRLQAPKGLSRPSDGHQLDVVVGKQHEVVLRDPR